MGDSLPWVRASSPPALAGRELHVWRASLDLAPALVHRLESTLDVSEKERANRFLIARARERFVAARGILRQLLGTYLEINPDKVEMRYGPQGKPSLSLGYNSKIQFNVSHSQDMGLFAFAKSAEVGVDIERVKEDFKGLQIATHFFSEQEAGELAKLPPKLVDEAFFDCWTRKEAYVKARGQGMSIPLGNFTVGFAEREQRLRDETGGQWSCYALKPAPGYAGAVVAAGEGWNLTYYDWSIGAELEALSFLSK